MLQEPLQGAKILGYSMQDTMDIEGIHGTASGFDHYLRCAGKNV